MDLMKEARSIESKPDGEPVEPIGKQQRGNRIYLFYRGNTGNIWYETRFFTGVKEVSEYESIFGERKRKRR